ncbi:hydrogenase nickel incorporation protein HypB [Desulforhopalus singaporensis]|uniref:Hydrogenase nickel incorporation protein HypB n=1 Tax=Desulforhopalus singaporensis TaxID=91360 RepID=A0A1H0T0S7_9BACT|nr:hydrogenase nickel incorporation protein HypB [Desulforhopalus singaporensis]SDP47544.1 Hydrogenase nickel incorporation protein HypB [Desulforhopalus singaporensis]
MENIRLIEVKENILADNDVVAQKSKSRLSDEKTFLVNLMASPGAGKTTLILKTLEILKNQFRTGVIEADIDSMVDAEKVAAQNITAVQLRTGGFCHLDASMVENGLDNMDLDKLDLVIIENVGNLVCPAEFDTGAIKNVMILSVPEGDDKPLKYPLMFSVCDVLLVNKIDYLHMTDFDLEAMRERVLTLNPKIRIFEVSAKTGDGIEAWASWLADETTSFIE